MMALEVKSDGIVCLLEELAGKKAVEANRLLILLKYLNPI